MPVNFKLESIHDIRDCAMTLRSPDEWKPLAVKLSELIASGQSLDDAIRKVSAQTGCGRLFLCRAIQEVCAISHREAIS